MPPEMGEKVKQDREGRFEFDECMKYSPVCRCKGNKS